MVGENAKSKKKFAIFPICFIFVGLAGLIISLTGLPTLPSSFHSSPWMKYISWLTVGTCPASIQSARSYFSQTFIASISSYLFSLSGSSNTTFNAEGGRGASSGGISGGIAGTLIDPVTGLRIFTLDELSRYDGSDSTLSPPLLLAIWGDVFDVSVLGKDFYSPGMSYSCFGGRDGTRALTLGSLDKLDVNSLDVSDFDANFFKMMMDQHSFYVNKYPRVGVLADGTKANYRGPHKQQDYEKIAVSENDKEMKKEDEESTFKEGKKESGENGEM